MIASIQGPVLSAGAGWVVVGVGGLGLRVEVPSGRAAAHTPGEQLSLHTSLVVREDSLTLFGFATADELEVFGQLLAVSGVGPRSALGVLSELTPSEIAAAVFAEDEKPFKRVSGIGPKTAKLIAVSLAGKLRPEAFAPAAETPVAVDGDQLAADAVRAGLMGLGWGESDAERAVSDARAAGAPGDQAGLLRAALALLQAPRARTGSSAR
ncbi:Holliday junction branch migration protein RuvA [Leucobacter sp. HNU]|uniref:Holliday junction branch migration protein RuvA n=1 Tax=Leucobacter sp. HNU TaxID=3236805 RepID=UPI003A7FBC78